MADALAARLGWKSQGLQDMYIRRSAPVPGVTAPKRAARRQSASTSAGSGGSGGSGGGGGVHAPKPCALTDTMDVAARQANRWDLLLYEDALLLDALDRSFFARPSVQRALRTPLGGEGGGGVGDAPPPSDGLGASGVALAAAPHVGSAAGCGFLTEALGAPIHPAGGAPPSLRPVCMHKRWRHDCCWGVSDGTGGGGAAGAFRMTPMPRLPPPVACVLPPAGALSSQPAVRMPMAGQKHHHGGCALSCRGFDFFGLENAGVCGRLHRKGTQMRAPNASPKREPQMRAPNASPQVRAPSASPK